jgi:hypothetical protein
MRVRLEGRPRCRGDHHQGARSRRGKPAGRRGGAARYGALPAGYRRTRQGHPYAGQGKPPPFPGQAFHSLLRGSPGTGIARKLVYWDKTDALRGSIG